MPHHSSIHHDLPLARSRAVGFALPTMVAASGIVALLAIPRRRCVPASAAVVAGAALLARSERNPVAVEDAPQMAPSRAERC